MDFFVYVIVDEVLEPLFKFVLLLILLYALTTCRGILSDFSLRSRRRLPFGLVSVLLIACAWRYGKWALAREDSWRPAPGESQWHLLNSHSVEFYLLLAGMLLIVFPAGASASLWYDFHRRDPEKVLRKAGRRAVLLLRNFSGDESKPSTSRHIELALRKRLPRSLGPIVTFGSPQDFSPPSGALRRYQPDDRWREQVVTYLDLSGFVVLIALRWSSSLKWEMEVVQRSIPPDRAVVILVHKTHGWSGSDFDSRCDLIVFKDKDDAHTRQTCGAGLSALSEPACVGGDRAGGIRDLYASMDKHIRETYHDGHRVRDGALVLGFEADWSSVVLANEAFEGANSLYLADAVWSRFGQKKSSGRSAFASRARI